MRKTNGQQSTNTINISLIKKLKFLSKGYNSSIYCEESKREKEKSEKNSTCKSPRSRERKQSSKEKRMLTTRISSTKSNSLISENPNEFNK
jgi:hypothetical protein